MFTVNGKRERTVSLDALGKDSTVADITGSPTSMAEVEYRNEQIFEPEAPGPTIEDVTKHLLGEATIFDRRPSREEILQRLGSGESLRKVERVTGVPKSTLSRWRKEHMQLLADLESRVTHLEDEQARIAQRMAEISRANPDDDVLLREMDAYLLGVTDAEKVSHFSARTTLAAPTSRG